MLFEHVPSVNQTAAKKIVGFVIAVVLWMTKAHRRLSGIRLDCCLHLGFIESRQYQDIVVRQVYHQSHCYVENRRFSGSREPAQGQITSPIVSQQTRLLPSSWDFRF
jgi:hypothetical protein